MGKKIKSYIKKLSIGQKSIIATLILSFGVLLIGVSAYFGVAKINSDYERLLKEDIIPLNKLQKCREKYISDIFAYIYNDRESKDIKELGNSAKKSWNEYLRACYYQNRNLSDDFQNDIQNVQKEITVIDEFISSWKKNSDKKPFLQQLYKLDTALSSLYHQYENRINTKADKDRSNFSQAQYFVIVLTILLTLLTLFLSYLIAKSFKKMVENLADISQKVDQAYQKNEQEIIAKVEEAVKEARRNDQIIYQNARLASMGEMIANIAHQWRQPLNALTLLIQSFGIKSMTGKLTQEFIDKQVEEGLRLAVSMSDTIEDFRNFFSINREKEYFDLKETIDTTLEMSAFFIKDENIEIIVDAKEDIKVYGYANEFSQVLINLINNARENFKQNSILESKMIKIKLKKFDNKIVLDFLDNGGGVDEAIIDRIFEPYFTTKHKSIGTGIGLYMSKQIIEMQIGGEISVENIECEYKGEFFKCAKFSITLPHN